MKAKHQNTRFCVINEENISPVLDKAIRETLVVCFPSDREHFQRHSWWHCVPVYRVLGRDDRDSIVAHTAVVERSVIVGRNLSKVRVAGVQSFCVLPDYRGTGLSDRMMSITMEQANRRGFDTGLLFCLNRMKIVYARMGWHKLDSEVYMRDDKACRALAPPPAATRCVKSHRGESEPRREGKTPIPAKNITMFYPLGIRQFPPGDIDLAGTDW